MNMSSSKRFQIGGIRTTKDQDHSNNNTIGDKRHIQTQEGKLSMKKKTFFCDKCHKGPCLVTFNICLSMV